MTSRVKPRRGYHSPRRAEQALATRRAVLDAARALFIEQGFAATTIDAIARRAGLSAETVYASFGSKRALLAELVDVSIAGGDGAPPVPEQDWVREMRSEPDARRRLAILALNGSRILERRSDLDDVVRGAATADPEIAALWQRLKTERHAGQRRLLEIVMAGATLRPGLDLEAAAAILYAIGSPETYRLLVADRGWSAEQFAAWYGEALEALLLPASVD